MKLKNLVLELLATTLAIVGSLFMPNHAIDHHTHSPACRNIVDIPCSNEQIPTSVDLLLRDQCILCIKKILRVRLWFMERVTHPMLLTLKIKSLYR